MNDPFLSHHFLSERARIIDEHRRIILEMRTIEDDIAKRMRHKDPSWRELESKRNELYIRVEPLIDEYWRILPAVKLSVCPYCEKSLERLFDAVDLNGFWWMDRTRRPKPEPASCPHFCLLTGALNVHNYPVAGGLFECLPGPDAPFVIPRLLEYPAMQAVVSCINMHCGYSAYPVAYFAEQPPDGKFLTQPWADKVFHFTDSTGRRGWDIKEESYDYNLATWIKSGKLRWFLQGRLNASGDDPSTCEFLNIQGVFRPQIVIHNERRYR